MGIKGLIPALKDVIESGVHVRKFQGHKVAVDTYSWLHKGTFGCALELCIGAPTDTYITYCTDRVKMLLHNNVTPVMVFDGANLPSKDGTENSRKNRREVEMAKGKHLLKAGNRAGATACFQRAVDVTPEMAHKLIKALKKMNVEIIVAPYEADAQLTFLNLRGYVAGIITEDTDMIAFGARTILFKMDKEGYGDEYRQKVLGACENMRLSAWEPERVTQMCIFAGCDYLKSINSMGIMKAHSCIYNSAAHTAPIEECYVKAIAKLKMDGFSVPPDYAENFRRAYLTFQHQRVYHPEEKRLVPLKPIPPELEGEDMPYIGADLPQHIAEGVGEGLLHPITYEPWPKDPPPRAPPASLPSQPHTKLSKVHNPPKQITAANLRSSPRKAASPGRQGSPRKQAKAASPGKQGSPRKQAKRQPALGRPAGAQSSITAFVQVGREDKLSKVVASCDATRMSDGVGSAFKRPRTVDEVGVTPIKAVVQIAAETPPEVPLKRLKTRNPFVPTGGGAARVRSKFFSNTAADTGARGEEESGVLDLDAVRLAEREAQREAESRAVDDKLGQLSYKGAGTEGVRRVGGDGLRRSATRVGGPSNFVDRMRGGGGGAVGGRVTLRGGARKQGGSLPILDLEGLRFGNKGAT